MWTLSKISTKALCLFIIFLTGGGRLTNGTRTRSLEVRMLDHTVSWRMPIAITCTILQHALREHKQLQLA